jgi:hypothetical protein
MSDIFFSSTGRPINFLSSCKISVFLFLFSVISKEIIMRHPEMQAASPEYANHRSFLLHSSSWKRGMGSHSFFYYLSGIISMIF